MEMTPQNLTKQAYLFGEKDRLEALAHITNENEHTKTVQLIEEFSRRRNTGTLFHDDTERLAFVYTTQERSRFLDNIMRFDKNADYEEQKAIHHLIFQLHEYRYCKWREPNQLLPQESKG